MNHTQNFGLNKPLPDEFYDIEKQNENMDRIDEALKEVKDKAEDSTGSIPEFVQAETRENIKNGETTGRLFGKIARFFADLKPVAFSGSYSDLSNKPNIPSVPDSVKNPHPLSINGHSYDGSAAINAGTIGITYGGTGATTAEAARTNLGLGTAATQEIANNLTTTEAGYALDARQGKVLWDEVGEINSNLTDSGKITSYEVREGDGVYITYLDGADTVTKKLGEQELLYQTKGSNYPAFSNGLNWYTFNFPNKMIGISSISVQGGDGRPDMNAEYSRYDFANQRVGIYWINANNPYRGYVSVTAVGY